jgi:hypothetical protein
LTESARDGHKGGAEEEHAHDDEREDPLEGDDLGGELSEGQRYGKVLAAENFEAAGILTQREDSKRHAHRPILEDGQEEAAKHHDAPDDDVRKDASGQITGVHGSGAVPENRHIVPGVGKAHDWSVNPERSGWVAEVERCQVEEVGDKDDLARPEVGADPAHDEAELHEVVLERCQLHGR